MVFGLLVLQDTNIITDKKRKDAENFMAIFLIK